MATILIVDDRPMNRQFLVTLLGYLGHDLIEAADGEEALQRTLEDKPDLVIVDIMMPVLNGFEYVERMRSQQQAAPEVMFYTATYRLTEVLPRARELGVKYVLKKPAEPREILEAVEEALDVSKALSLSEFESERKNRELLVQEVRHSRFAAMLESAQDFAEQSDSQKMLDLAAGSLKALAGGQCAAVGMLNDAGTDFRLLSRDGFPVSWHPAVPSSREVSEERLVLPVTWQGQVCGWSWVEEPTRGGFEAEDARMVGALLGLLSLHLENRRNIDSLSARTEELARSNRDLERFAFAASHDLKEPLRTVASFSQLLSMGDEELSETKRQYVEFVQSGAARAVRLLEGLLEYSRYSLKELHLQRFDFNDVYSSTVASLRSLIEETGTRISANSLPTIVGDPRLLELVLSNLLRNAIVFRGEEPPQIEVTGKLMQRGFRIDVKDNGIGVDPEYQDDIFVIFKRLHTRDERPGDGLGLALSSRLIHKHGGQLTVRSRPGQGSTFSFTIPSRENSHD